MLFFIKTETNVSWRGGGEKKSNAHDAVLTEEQLQWNSCQNNFVLVHKTRRDASEDEESLMLWGERGNTKLSGIASSYLVGIYLALSIGV